MTENDPATTPRPQTRPEQRKTKRVVKKGKLAYSDNPEICSHPIFFYLTEKRATQVCKHCKARRRIRFSSTDNTATVGEWKHE